MARSGVELTLDLISAWAVLTAFGIPRVWLLMALFTAVAVLLGLYGPDRPRAPGVRFLALVFSTGAACVGLGWAGSSPWRPWIAWMATTSLVRSLLRWIATQTAPPALIVGTGPDSRRLARDLRRMAWPVFRVLGFWEPSGPTGRLDTRPILTDSNPPSDDVVFLDPSHRRRPLPQHARVLRPRRRFLEKGGTWVWEGQGNGGEDFHLTPEGPAEGLSGAVKRVLDTLIVLAALPAALVVILIAALVLWAREGSPIFYRQVRWTYRRQPFSIWKLRSMPTNAEGRGQPVWPSADDPRISPFGALLRRLWLDELPQLWNVLKGELSLVGPRPERPAFAQVFLDGLPMYHMRYAVRAGITGWAQIQGYVGNTSLRKRLFCDLQYIDRWSPGFDLAILARTLCQMVRRPRRRRFDYVPERGTPIP